MWMKSNDDLMEEEKKRRMAENQWGEWKWSK